MSSEGVLECALNLGFVTLLKGCENVQWALFCSTLIIYNTIENSKPIKYLS